MAEIAFNPEKKRLEFEKLIVGEYLRLGSVDEVFKVHNYDLPISYSDTHRLIKRWGIVKAAGPNAHLSEALEFLTVFSRERISVGKLYKRMPLSFKTSMSTLHRILTLVRKETIRRIGTALVISPKNNPNLVLVGNDVSTPRPELGKLYGSISLPMGYSSRTESSYDSILRVLQQEVFTNLVIDNKFPISVVPENLAPFMYLDIADVRVAVYKLNFSRNFARIENFSSFKIVNHRYLHLAELSENTLKGYRFRTGVREIALGYAEYLRNLVQSQNSQPIFTKSLLNLHLVEAVDRNLM